MVGSSNGPGNIPLKDKIGVRTSYRLPRLQHAYADVSKRNSLKLCNNDKIRSYRRRLCSAATCLRLMTRLFTLAETAQEERGPNISGIGADGSARALGA